MNEAPLLIELHTEELPPKALAALGDAFAGAIARALAACGLADDDRHRMFATPRRLALYLDAVRTRAPDRVIELKGPSVKVGLDAQGKPTQALIKWAQRQNIPIDSLEQRDDGKQAVFYARAELGGESLSNALQGIVEQALAKLPIPKLMQYQLADGITTVSFVRPARRLVVLHGAHVVPVSVLGLESGRETFGHRFLSSGALSIASADAYEATLESAHVLASFESRRERIEQALRHEAAAQRASLGDETDVGALLDEVCALVEWPAVYVGEFDAEFLAVPQECLILTMRTNQKYFPLFDQNGRLRNRFLIVSNMAIADPRDIIDGNERVVRPRLSDARFFFDQDRRQTLAKRLPLLESVVYHAKLGTMARRVERVREIARALAHRIGADVALAERAAQLAKCDLLTGMVGEFPELQGLMGRYYALHDQEPPEVAEAIAEQYLPRFAGDALPASSTGVVLALADKLETLAGLFAIGQVPTGDKDPFALRRHALGVLRMLIDHHLELPLDELLKIAFGVFEQVPATAANALESFFFERLVGLLRESGFEGAQIAAVTALRPMLLAAVPARLNAVREFARLPEAQSLASANKRIGNILRKAGGLAGSLIDRSALVDPAEHELADALRMLEPLVDAAMHAQDFTGAMTAMAGTRAAVDRFFDQVMVMADDERLRNNRLALLSHLHGLMNRVADISKLAPA